MNEHRHLLVHEDITPEERLNALAEVLAEGFLYLAENGLLKEGDEAGNTTPLPDVKILQAPPLTSVGKEGNPSSQDHRRRRGRTLVL